MNTASIALLVQGSLACVQDLLALLPPASHSDSFFLCPNYVPKPQGEPTCKLAEKCTSQKWWGKGGGCVSCHVSLYACGTPLPTCRLSLRVWGYSLGKEKTPENPVPPFSCPCHFSAQSIDFSFFLILFSKRKTILSFTYLKSKHGDPIPDSIATKRLSLQADLNKYQDYVMSRCSKEIVYFHGNHT